MRCGATASCTEDAADGRKMCARHLEMRRTYMRNWQQANRAKGLCTSCSKPAAPGKSVCARHGKHDPNAWRDSRLKKLYGISEREYEALLIEQMGVCRICRRPETHKGSRSTGIKNLAVDHDHDTGEVRGLLCNNCNRAIGLLDDNPDLLLRAASYLSGLVV